jgi:2-polyprenyl-3-methyl-5-hydroxy-6-metoxy-1,4-benzoquinol methylase
MQDETTPATSFRELTDETRAIWDAKADFWDERMGEGNAFQQTLVGPATERLLALREGERVLEIACGNGQMARRMATLGATVVATDFSRRFVELATARTEAACLSDRVTFQQLDATEETALLILGEGRYDAVVCNMALMDMTDVEPLFRAVARLLAPAGRFVFTIPHPCFNSNAVRFTLEEEDRGGELVETAAVKVDDYLNIPPGKGAGMPGEPAPHWYFHRPLSALLPAAFATSLVMDGIEEPSFPPGTPSTRALSWFRFSNIPPVLAVRMRVMVTRDA